MTVNTRLTLSFVFLFLGFMASITLMARAWIVGELFFVLSAVSAVMVLAGRHGPASRLDKWCAAVVLMLCAALAILAAL